MATSVRFCFPGKLGRERNVIRCGWAKTLSFDEMTKRQLPVRCERLIGLGCMASSQQANDPNAPTTTGPIQCINNCGFWGNPLTGNMCSKCYREKVKEEEMKKKAEAALQPPASEAPAPTPMEVTPTSPSAASATETSPSSPAKEAAQADTSKCWSCKRKVGLLGFRCRCNYVFCSKHRHADQHGCTFDYKAAAKEQLAKANPVVAASKITKI